MIELTGEDAAEAICSVTYGGTDTTIDAVGCCMGTALEVTRPGGRLVLFGMDQHSSVSVNQCDISKRELTLQGSFIQQTAFPKVVKLLESEMLPIGHLITHQLPLAEFAQALELLKSGEAIKVVLGPSGA